MAWESIKQKKLVFTVATGRCGTAFFAEILRLVPGTCSVHEPEPEYADVLRQVQQDHMLAHSFLVERKLPAIARDKSKIYIETSHLFCKGFLQALLALDIVPTLLWIRREHRAVASSMYRGGTIPGRTDKGMRFYLSPDDPGVLPVRDWQQLHDYQLCYWYCLEIERRAGEYRSLYQKNNWCWAETSLAEVITMQGMHKLVADLGLPELPWYAWLRYLNNRRRRVNPTSKAKQQIVLPEGLDELETEVRSLAGQGSK